MYRNSENSNTQYVKMDGRKVAILSSVGSKRLVKKQHMAFIDIAA